MSINEIGGALVAEKINEELKQKYEAEQKKNVERRFREMVCRVLNAIHLDRDHYGPLSVNESSRDGEFKSKITSICKEYL